jgi:hypothetical protein
MQPFHLTTKVGREYTRIRKGDVIDIDLETIHKLYVKIILYLMFRLFTPQDANKILPDIIRRFNTILTQKKHVVELQDELQRLVESGSSFEPFIKKKQTLNVAVSNLYKAIEQLENTGVMIKSVDEGLLDFPSMRFDEEVWLCWKAGETEVKFWHSKQEGFMGRKPLAPKGFHIGEDDLADLR